MKQYLITTLIIAVVTFSACSNASAIDETNGTEQKQPTAEQAASTDQNATEIQQSTQFEYPTNDFAIEGESTFIDEKEVVITKSGRYEFSGDYTEIVVNVNKDIDEGVVYLVLNNTNIQNENGTPINIIEAKDAVIVLEGENIVTQGQIVTTDTEFPSAAIYSAADTAIIGDGSLSVSTLYQDGINSRDDLVIEGGTINITAVEDGIVGKDLVAISGEAVITIDSGKDGLKASNDQDLDRGNLIILSGKFDIKAQNDAISAEQILQIDGGQFSLYSGDGYVEVLNEITRGEGSGNNVQPTDLLEDSMKGIKASDITINKGDFLISSYEDGVHANNNATINGGTFTINAGDDAVHADFDLTINDGNLTVENAYEGLEGSAVTINGGNIDLNVLDDAINASADGGLLKITDGQIQIVCQGDGIDSNGDLTIEGGNIVIEANSIYSGGDGALDVTGIYSLLGGSVTDENGNELEVMTQGGRGGQQGGQQGTQPGVQQGVQQGQRPQRP